jgi:hypothetical protein
MNPLQQPHEVRLRGLQAAMSPRLRGTHRNASATAARAKAGPWSAKADFVPFQRRVSNPSCGDRGRLPGGPLFAIYHPEQHP